MPDELIVPVSAPGASQAAADVDKFATSLTRAAGTPASSAQAATERMGKAHHEAGGQVEKHGNAWEHLKEKLTGARELRHVTESVGLLALGSERASGKIAGFAAVLGSIPGPIGLLATGMAVGATAFEFFSKGAEEAEKHVAELTKKLDELNAKRDQTMTQVAKTIEGAVGKVGVGVRGFNASEASSADREWANKMMPGRPAEAMKLAQQLATGAAAGADKDLLKAALEQSRAIGEEPTDKMVSGLVDAMKYAREAGSGVPRPANVKSGMFGDLLAPMQPKESAYTSLQDLIAAGLHGGTATSEQQSQVEMQIARSQGGLARAQEAALQAGEGPSIAQSGADYVTAVTGPLSGLGSEALRKSSDANTHEMKNLEDELSKLTDAIRSTKTEIREAEPSKGGWTLDWSRVWSGSSAPATTE